MEVRAPSQPFLWRKKKNAQHQVQYKWSKKIFSCSISYFCLGIAFAQVGNCCKGWWHSWIWYQTPHRLRQAIPLNSLVTPRYSGGVSFPGRASSPVFTPFNGHQWPFLPDKASLGDSKVKFFLFILSCCHGISGQWAFISVRMPYPSGRASTTTGTE